MNPQAPILNALIKLHKETKPIRPVVDYRCAPTYKVAKFMARWHKQNMNLPYTFYVNISSQGAQEIIKIKPIQSYKMITLDITSLHTNIPSLEKLSIIKTKLLNSTQGNLEQLEQIYNLLQITIKQNYYKVNDTVWLQKDGTPMGSPISSILAEVFLQEIESKYYTDMLKNRHIVYLARYVDDIFIIFMPPTPQQSK
jgi:retron-type reverse transcriptase